MDSILVKYFWSGMSYKNILVRLKTIHGVKRSLSWLKKKFRQLGLKRRGYCEQNPLLMKNILAMLVYNTPYSLRGYRAIYRLLRWKFHISVRRDTIMKLMRLVDPTGVAQRRKRRLKRRVYYSKGPNFVWHLDGYNKLKPYGLCIHACVDGFSRKVIWFTLATTNNDPRVISRYFLEAIEKIRGCPAIVRADFGTENCRVAKTQIALRMHHSDEFAGKKSFIYGPSTSNIRIEAFWSQWRRSICDWWISLCKSLVEEGVFNHDNLLHQYTLNLIFGTLLWCDMQEFMGDWNNHMIRRNKLSNSPSGRPQDLYDLPELQGVSDHKMPIDPNIWARCMLEESIKAPPLCPEDFAENALFFLERYFGMSINDITHSNCKQIYISLVNLLSHCL